MMQLFHRAVTQAAVQYAVTFNTILRKVRALHSGKYGRPSALSSEDESKPLKSEKLFRTINKTMFPCLLRLAVEKIGANSVANSKAGIRACVIVPFDTDVLLKKVLRSTAEENRNNENTWTQTLVDHLSTMRAAPWSQNPKREKN
ncbi:hypothetical protein HHI36_004796 [Cryptolaemus montrouzieri]|uniref:Uncharacterized protein n=1 Tax=Cryptolaemus montrouzieri TaxID=559131 RepID=A0ABD2NSX0_9CUCU